MSLEESLSADDILCELVCGHQDGHGGHPTLQVPKYEQSKLMVRMRERRDGGEEWRGGMEGRDDKDRYRWERTELFT